MAMIDVKDRSFRNMNLTFVEPHTERLKPLIGNTEDCEIVEKQVQ